MTNAHRAIAADVIKLAIIAVHDWLARSKLKTKLIMLVHDELVLETSVRRLGRSPRGYSRRR